MSSSHAKDVLPSDEKSPEDQDDAQIFDIESGPATTPASSSNHPDVHLDRPVQGGQRRKLWPPLINTLLWYLKDQWFLIALGILIAIASQVQVPASQQELKTTVVTYLCVSIIFLMTGCTLPTKTLIENYSRWKIHLFVQVQCFLMTSAVMFGVVSAAATNKDFMDPGLLIGELAVAYEETRKLMDMQVSFFLGVFRPPSHPTLWYVNMRTPPRKHRVDGKLDDRASSRQYGFNSCSVDTRQFSRPIFNTGIDLHVYLNRSLVHQSSAF